MSRMRKALLWFLSLVLLAAVALFPLAVFADSYKYYVEISIQDTGGSNRTAVPVLIPISGSSLNTNGFINTYGTDTDMKEGTTAEEFMMVSDQVATFIPNLAANQRRIYKLYTGYSPVQTEFPIITGTGGYITTLEDADLELGNEFELDMKGYLDTATGAGKNLVNKDGAFRAWVSAAEEITASIASTPSEFSSTSDGCIFAGNSVYATAQAAATGAVADTSATMCIGQTYGHPSIAGSKSGKTTPVTTSHVVAFDDTAVAGQLLLVMFDAGNTAGAVSFTVSTPAGWTALFDKAYNTGEKYSHLACFYKVAAGGEDSVTITTSASAQSGYVAYRIINYSGTPEAGTAATGNDTHPNPPSLSPTWGSANDLWIAVEGASDTSDVSVSGYPANYTLSQESAYRSFVHIGAAGRVYEGASEDPGTFTISSAQPWAANTIAISPGYTVDRSFVYFDTSSIPDTADIVSASVFLYGATDSSTTDFDIVLTNGMSTYPHDPLAAGDFDITHYSGTGNDTFSTAGFSTAGYNELTLTSTGLGWINVTGTTKLAICSSRDIAATTPTGDEYVTVYTSDQAGTDKDPYISVTYWSPAVTATGITSGLRTVIISADTHDLVIEVYDENDVLIDSDTEALGGASVPPNANPYAWGQNDVAPYWTYIKMTTAIGAYDEKLWYQPEAMISGTTLVDRDGTENGTITFGSNSSLTVVVGDTVPYDPTTASAASGGNIKTIPPVDQSASWYGEASAITTLPFYDTFNDAATSMGMPVKTLYQIIMLGTASAVGLGALVFTGSAMIAALVMTVTIGTGVTAGGGVLGSWMTFTALVLAVGILFLVRQH